MGGGIGMRNTCKPMAVSFQCMTKSTTIKKKKKEKKKKIKLRIYILTIGCKSVTGMHEVPERIMLVLSTKVIEGKPRFL